MHKLDYPTDLVELNTKLSKMTDSEHADLVKAANTEEVKRILEEGPPVLVRRFQSRLMEVVDGANAFGKGRFHLMTNRLGEAEKEFQRAVSEGIQVGGSYNNLANLAGDRGDLKSASEYQKLSIENGCYVARINLANTYFALGEPDLAREEFEEVWEVGEQGVAALYHTAVTFGLRNNDAGAIFILEFLMSKGLLDAMEDLCNIYYTLGDKVNFERATHELHKNGFIVMINNPSKESN